MIQHVCLRMRSVSQLTRVYVRTYVRVGVALLTRALITMADRGDDTGLCLNREDSESIISVELEVLKNVYVDEMNVLQHDKDVELQFHLTPSTGDNKEQQYVYLDLCIFLPISYPHVLPVVTYHQSRGLADTQLTDIQDGVSRMSAELRGTPMIYELIESVKESLTENNRPCEQCTLCLCDFTEECVFLKTDCYHYFHSLCLLRYVRYHQQEAAEAVDEERGRGEIPAANQKPLECPVCREQISKDSLCLKETLVHGEPVGAEDNERESSFVFVPGPSLRQWQCKMSTLLEKQRERGGVIDLTNKDDVIDLTWVRPHTQEESSERKGREGDQVMCGDHQEHKEVTGETIKCAVDVKPKLHSRSKYSRSPESRSVDSGYTQSRQSFDTKHRQSDSRNSYSDSRHRQSDSRPRQSDSRNSYSDSRHRQSDSRNSYSDSRHRQSDSRPKQPDSRHKLSDSKHRHFKHGQSDLGHRQSDLGHRQSDSRTDFGPHSYSRNSYSNETRPSRVMYRYHHDKTVRPTQNDDQSVGTNMRENEESSINGYSGGLPKGVVRIRKRGGILEGERQVMNQEHCTGGGKEHTK